MIPGQSRQLIAPFQGPIPTETVIWSIKVSRPVILAAPSSSVFIPSLSSSGAEDFVFYGKNGTECEKFISHVRRNALALGKQRDSQWMADYAASRMESKALRWLSKVPPEGKDTWASLEGQLLKRWPDEDEEVSWYGLYGDLDAILADVDPLYSWQQHDSDCSSCCTWTTSLTTAQSRSAPFKSAA